MKRAVLEIELHGTRIVARLAPPSAERGLRAVVSGERELETDLVRRLTSDVSHVLNRGTRWADSGPGSSELLRRKGATLFDALLPASIKAALRAMTSGDTAPVPTALVVSAPRTLAHIPWELLHTGFGFLGLELAIGRVESGHGAGATPRPTPPDRMLIIADPRGDLIGSYYEGLTLRDEIAQTPSGLKVDLRSSEVGRADVLELLRDYDVVHYAGHAERMAGGPRGWWLRDGVLTPDDIVELGGGPTFPRLVFVNACRSAGGGDDGGPGVTLADAFRRAGSAHVIGTVWDVPDEPASAFAIQFHAELVTGVSVGEAARRARLGVAARYGAGSVHWAAWVVHGEPSSSLFDERDEAAAASLETAAELDGLPALAARVRGVAATAAQVSSLDDHRRARWSTRGRTVLAMASVIGLFALVQLPGARRASDDARVVHTLASAEFGPIERIAAAPLAPPLEPIAALADGIGPAFEPRSLELEIVSSAGPGRALARGEAFRVRWSAPDDGWVTVWRVDAEGARHLGPVLVPAFAAAVVDLPVGGAWYTRSGSASERILVAWRRTAPTDAGELVDELRALVAVPSASAAIRVREALEDRFDHVEAVEVPLADGATGAIFR